MDNHTLAQQDSSKSDPITDLEARLKEIEAGIVNPLSFTGAVAKLGQ